MGVLPLRRAAGRAATVAAAALAAALATMPAATGEHLVAAVVTRDSVHQPHGGEVERGAKAAAERLNAKGGLLGAGVRVVAFGEDCSRERALALAEEIVRLEPVLVVGHLCAGAAMTAAPVYARAGIVAIVPGVSHPGLAGAGEDGLVLRLAGRDDRLAAEMAALIAARFPATPVAIVADRSQQARALAASLAIELGRREVRIAHDERIASGEKSYADVAGRVARSGAGLVVMPAQATELAILADDLARAGLTVPFVGSAALAIEQAEPVARRLGAGLVVMLPWSGLEPGAGEGATPTEAAARQQLAVRRRAEAAVEAWAEAVRRTGAIGGREVAQALRDGTAATVVGPVRFDAAGDLLVPSFVPHSWRGDGWRPLRQ